MKNLLKLSLLAVLTVAGASCAKEKTETIPSFELGEVTLSEDEKSATVEVIPSGNAEEIHWTCVEQGGLEYENGAILRDEKFVITLPNIKLDTDYKLSAYVRNSAGQSQPIVKEFIFRTEELIPELAQIKLLNSTIITADIRVIKSVKCSKYTVTLMKKWEMVTIDADGNPLETPEKREMFNEDDFVEQSDRTVAAHEEFAKGDNGDQFKMFAVYPMETKTADFGEYNLLRANNLKTRPNDYMGVPIEAGEEYVVAVCAYDAEGGHEVYTQDITIPETSPIKGTVDMKIELLDVDKSYSKVTARFTADAGCKRIFYGISVPDEWNDAGSQDMTTMTNSEFEKCLMTLSLGQAHIYNGPIEAVLKDNIIPGARRVIWAIGVDAAGNIGKVDRAFFTAPRYSPKGKASITSVDKMENAADCKSVSVTVSLSENAKKLRVLAASDVDWSAYSSDTNYWLYLPAEDGGGVYNEYDVVDGKATFQVRFINDDNRKSYFIFAAAVDENGDLSYSKNLVSTYTSWSLSSWPIPVKEDETFTLDGKGEVSIAVSEKFVQSSFDGDSYKADFTITPGANAAAVYCIPFVWDTSEYATIDKYIAETYKKKSDFPTSSMFYKKFTGTDPVKFLNKQGMEKFDEAYGGNVVLFFTEDTDGKIKFYGIHKFGSVCADSTTPVDGTVPSYSK
mgnify:FL=1